MVTPRPRRRTSVEFDDAAVEFVPGDPFTRPVDHRIRHRHSVAISEGERGAESADPVDDAGHRMPVELQREVQQTRALTVNGSGRAVQRRDVFSQFMIGRQLVSVFFGEPPSDDESCCALGQSVDERIELDDLGACRA